MSMLVQMMGMKCGNMPVSMVPSPAASTASAASLCSLMKNRKKISVKPSRPGTSRSPCTNPLCAAESPASLTTKLL